MSQSEYDNEIAPELLRLANRCKDLGMPFTATVEYAPGERGVTASGIDDSNLDMTIPYLASVAGSRLDDFMVALVRRIRAMEIPHSCVCLTLQGLDGDPSKR
jgi:hypothetical protein